MPLAAWSPTDLDDYLSGEVGGRATKASTSGITISVVTKRTTLLVNVTARVRYSTVEADLAADAGSTTTPVLIMLGNPAALLEMPITGLAADTVYFYRIEVLDVIGLAYKYIAYDAGETPKFTTFPNAGTASVVMLMPDHHEYRFGPNGILTTSLTGYWNQRAGQHLFADVTGKIHGMIQLGDAQLPDTYVPLPVDQNEMDGVYENNCRGPFYRVHNRAAFTQMHGNHEHKGGDAMLSAAVASRKKYFPQDASVDSDNQTNFTFVCGDTRYIFIDPWTRTTTYTAEADFILGAGYMEFLHDTLRTNTSAYVCVVMHSLCGGVSSTPLYYARGSGIESLNGTNANQKRLHQWCTRYGVIAVLKGHDHTFCHAVLDGVNYVTCGHHGRGLNHVDNQESTLGSYGTMLPQALKPHVLKYMGICGYARLDISTSRFRMRWVRTAPLFSDIPSGVTNPAYDWTKTSYDLGTDVPRRTPVLDRYCGVLSTATATIVTFPTILDGSYLGVATPRWVAGLYRKADGDNYLAGGSAPNNLWIPENVANIYDFNYSLGHINHQGVFSNGEQVYVDCGPMIVYDVDLNKPAVAGGSASVAARAVRRTSGTLVGV